MFSDIQTTKYNKSSMYNNKLQWTQKTIVFTLKLKDFFLLCQLLCLYKLTMVKRGKDHKK